MLTATNNIRQHVQGKRMMETILHNSTTQYHMGFLWKITKFVPVFSFIREYNFSCWDLHFFSGNHWHSSTWRGKSFVSRDWILWAWYEFNNNCDWCSRNNYQIFVLFTLFCRTDFLVNFSGWTDASFNTY